MFPTRSQNSFKICIGEIGGSYLISRLTRSLGLISELVISNVIGKNSQLAVPSHLYNIFQHWKLLTSTAFERKHSLC